MPEGWTNADASEYAYKLMSVYGPPSYQSAKMVTWEGVDNFDRVTVIDESVPHRFPMPHRDFVYSVRRIIFKPVMVAQVLAVTGSAIFDSLKGEVTARCGMVIKNAVTLGWVEDVARGAAPATRDEYARRIKMNEIPGWFPDSLGEGTQSFGMLMVRQQRLQLDQGY